MADPAPDPVRTRSDGIVRFTEDTTAVLLYPTGHRVKFRDFGSGSDAASWTAEGQDEALLEHEGPDDK